MLNMIDVGNQIAFLRKKNRFTQEELAEKLGITAQAISKWENGHTLPETDLLPLLADLLNSSIDSILMPFAAQDSAFKNFVRAGGKQNEFALQLYQRLKNEFAFTVNYNEEYHIFENVYPGHSAVFNIADKEDFIIRIDVEVDNAFSVRIPLVHCSSYMHLIEKMPEHIKRNFRCSDCKSCTCNCPYLMAYNFEEKDYKQCHFITIGLDSLANMEYILALAGAEHERFLSGKTLIK